MKFPFNCRPLHLGLDLRRLLTASIWIRKLTSLGLIVPVIIFCWQGWDKKYFQNNIKCDYSYLEPVGEYPKLFNSKQIFNDFQTASELKSFIVLHHNFDVVTFVREWRIPTDECNGIHQNKKQISVAIHCFSFTRGKYYSISFVYLLKLIHLHAVWIPLVPIILNELAFAFSSFSNSEALFMIRRGTEFSLPDAKLWK